MQDFAIQLYSVRNELKADFAGTLAALRRIGFSGVELAFYYGDLEPTVLAETMRATGLRVWGIYERVENLMVPESACYAYAAAVGCRYLTCGLSLESLEKDLAGALRQIRAAVATAAGHGCQVCYHAHAHEFKKVGGVSYLERILSECPGVLYEADTAWIHAGGEEVGAHLRQHAALIPLLHIKDLTAAGKITEVGSGVVDIAGALRAARASSELRMFSYEQDSSEIGSLRSAEVSLDYLRAL